MPAGRGMTTSPVLGRPGVKLHEGKASGLVVKVWDAHARSLLSFSLNERIHSWTTVKVRPISFFSWSIFGTRLLYLCVHGREFLEFSTEFLAKLFIPVYILPTVIL